MYVTSTHEVAKRYPKQYKEILKARLKSKAKGVHDAVDGKFEWGFSYHMQYAVADYHATFPKRGTAEEQTDWSVARTVSSLYCRYVDNPRCVWRSDVFEKVTKELREILLFGHKKNIREGERINNLTPEEANAERMELLGLLRRSPGFVEFKL